MGGERVSNKNLLIIMKDGPTVKRELNKEYTVMQDNSLLESRDLVMGLVQESVYM